MTQSIQDWLNEMPPESEIEWKEGIDDKGNTVSVAYQPIWVIEDLLNSYCKKMERDHWDRSKHHYSFVEIGNFVYLATSHEILILGRSILCSSCIKISDYPNNTNYLQTGIAEATKAGVKVLGNRFGASLNDRKALKSNNVPDGNGSTANIRPKATPDADVRKHYAEAIASGKFNLVREYEKNYEF